MTRSLRIVVPALAALAAAATLAAGSGGGFSMSVLVDGSPVPEYSARGRVYIEALKGREFTIRLSNPTSARVAVALSVDGRNVVDAKRTTELAATKWILAPGQTADIPGWQVSGETSRRFYFTETSKSYARWLGDTSSVGTIEAVFFREKRCEASAPRVRPLDPAPAENAAGRAEGRASAAPAAPTRRAKAADEYAATGIGEATRFPVQWAAFDEDPDPAARIALRYEFRPQLVRLGVLPREDPDLFARDGARGFEHSYAPDPYGHR